LLDGKLLALTPLSSTHNVEVRHATTGKVLRQFPTGRFYCDSLAFSPDGKVLAGAGVHGLALWTVGSEKGPRWLNDNREVPDRGVRERGLIFLRGGHVLACGCSDGFVHFWDSDTGKPVGGLATEYLRLAVRDLALSPDGQLLACIGQPQQPDQKPRVQVWELASGRKVQTIKVPGKPFTSLAFAPDSVTLTVADQDGVIRLWNVFSGKETGKLTGHDGAVTCLAYSPDGKTLASGGADTTVLLWDVRKFLSSPAPLDADARRLASLWEGLAKQEPEDAHEAAWALAGAGDRAVEFLRGRLQPQAAPTKERLRQLIADLDAKGPATRRKAVRELARLGESAVPALRNALEGNVTLDAKRAIGALLEGIKPWSDDPDVVRDLRALSVLERIGSPAALKLLESLAGGEPAVRLTREAKAACEHRRRMAKQ